MAVVVPCEGVTLHVTIAGTPTIVPGLLGLTPPQSEAETVDTFGLSSSFKSKRASLMPDPGELNFRIQIDPNDETHQYLRGKAVTPTQVADIFKITYPDTFAVHAFDTFSGFVTKFAPDEMEPDANLEGELTVVLSTKVTFTEGAAS